MQTDEALVGELGLALLHFCLQRGEVGVERFVIVGDLLGLGCVTLVGRLFQDLRNGRGELACAKGARGRGDEVEAGQVARGGGGGRRAARGSVKPAVAWCAFGSPWGRLGRRVQRHGLVDQPQEPVC